MARWFAWIHCRDKEEADARGLTYASWVHSVKAIESTIRWIWMVCIHRMLFLPLYLASRLLLFWTSSWQLRRYLRTKMRYEILGNYCSNHSRGLVHRSPAHRPHLETKCSTNYAWSGSHTLWRQSRNTCSFWTRAQHIFERFDAW